MSDDHPIYPDLRRKPSRIANNGWARDFTEAQELTKPEQRRMLADAVRNTAAMKPQKPKEKRYAKRN